MKHKLMIKTHNKTGLKYLCYTKTSGDVFESYKGSGTRWRNHLKKRGDSITTEIIFESDDYHDFKSKAIETSIKLNVVESKDWANLKIEEGDGGSSTHGRRWAHDGTNQIYLKKGETLPTGFHYGRIKCVFNDPEKQKEFASKVDHEKRSKSLKKTWDDGRFKRDNTYLVEKMTGENNPTKRPEVVEKIRKAALADSQNRSDRMKRIWEKRRGNG